LLFVG